MSVETTFITLYGRPNAGKLTTAAYMAKHFAEADNLDVVILLANNYEPKAGVIFSKGKALQDKKSLGELIIAPALTETEVLRNLAPLPAKQDKVYILGYKNGENPFTSTAPVPSQMKEFFGILGTIADVVISVPMALFWTDALSGFMMAENDFVYYLHELSPQGLSFFRSGRDQLAACPDHERVSILNKIEKEDEGLTRAYAEEIGEIGFKLPYVAEIGRNYKNGSMGAALKTPEGREYATEIRRMCDHALIRMKQREKGGAEHGKPHSA